jgi:hypothetical protein
MAWASDIGAEIAEEFAACDPVVVFDAERFAPATKTRICTVDGCSERRLSGRALYCATHSKHRLLRTPPKPCAHPGCGASKIRGAGARYCEVHTALCRAPAPAKLCAHPGCEMPKPRRAGVRHCEIHRGLGAARGEERRRNAAKRRRAEARKHGRCSKCVVRPAVAGRAQCLACARHRAPNAIRRCTPRAVRQVRAA